MTAEHATPNPMLVAALDAWDNGLCVVRAKTDGSKRPDGEWKQYQSHRPTREQVAAWFADGHPGMGVICGAVSDDLEMFELEGRFMADNGRQRFTDAMRDAGLDLLLRRLTNGFCTVSPSDGRHFLYRCAGAIDGNTKLALNAASETLIETRGEGGFVVVPPSHGTTHPTGRPWVSKSAGFAAIPTITPEERDALFAVARTFDQAPAVGSKAPTRPVNPVRVPTGHTGGNAGTSWMDATVEHLARTYTMRQLLEHYGWTYSHDDRHGRVLMTRPGKTEGVSGSINERGRLCVFSTSTPFAAPGGQLSPTYDLLDVIAHYEHGGDRKTAGRHVATQAGILRPPADPFMVRPPANIDPATGEVLDAPEDIYGAEFWQARPYLEHIRHAARSATVAPAALLGAVLARVAAFTPPSTCLPAIIGGTVPLSLLVALRGKSGDGKSTPVAAAGRLLPHVPPGCVEAPPLGSGEGLIDTYFDLVEETVDGKTRKVKRQTYHGALFTLDEGQVLAELASRKGATIMPILRTVFTGGSTGQANASIETRRHLRAGTYSIGLVSLWQDEAAAALLADQAGGTPQRFLWMPTTDQGATEDDIDWPGPLDWEAPALIRMDGVIGTAPMDVHPDIRRDIKRHQVQKLRGEIEVDPLDAHRRLLKLKIAGVLAVLDGRRNIALDDWELAERVLSVSDGVRAWVIAEARRRTDEADMAVAKRHARREVVVAETVADKALERAARACWRAANVAHEAGTRATRRDMHNRVSAADRRTIGVDTAIADALSRGWIEGDKDYGWTVGKSRPT